MDKTLVFRRRIFSVLVIRYTLRLLCFYAFTAGIAILAVKMLASTALSPLWLLYLLPLPLALALILAFRKLPASPDLLALLDKHNNLGGLLMASRTIPLGQWQNSVSNINIPKIRFASLAPLGLVLTSAVFLTICAILPPRILAVTDPRPININSQFEDLRRDIDLLKQENTIDQAKLAQLEQKLDTARQSGSDADPVKAWEALDSLRQELGDLAQAGATTAVADVAKMSQASDIANSLAQDANSFDPSTLSQAMAQLSADIGKLSSSQPLQSQLGSEMAQGLNSASLSPEQLKKLSEALAKAKMSKSASVSKMCKNGLIDPDLLKMCDKASQARSDALAALRQGSCSGGNCQGSCSLPGRGGVSRGRGDAQLTFGDESSSQQTAFKEKMLEPSALGDLDQTSLVGETATAPELAGEQAPSAPANISAAPSPAGANKYNLLPKHRNTVKNYFERSK